MYRIFAPDLMENFNFWYETLRNTFKAIGKCHDVLCDFNSPYQFILMLYV